MAMMRALVYDGSIVVPVVDVEHGVMRLAGLMVGSVEISYHGQRFVDGRGGNSKIFMEGNYLYVKIKLTLPWRGH